MFPQGGPGIALLLLRTSVAAIFVADARARFGEPLSHLLLAGVLSIAILLFIGFLTPFSSAIACISGLVDLLIGPHSSSIIFAVSMLDAAALLLLGPGAYSLDARLFGRRVVIVPRREDRD